MTKRKESTKKAKEIPYGRDLNYDEDGRLHFFESYGLRSRRASPDSYADLFHDNKVHNETLKIIQFAKDLLQKYQDANRDDYIDIRAKYGETPLSWSKYIETKKGTLSIETTAAVFHELLDEIFLGFLSSNEIDLAIHDSDPRYLKFREQVFQLCDAWHWLHMECFDEHRKALRGDRAEAIGKKGADGNAAKRKRKEAVVEEQVRLFCRTQKSKPSAGQMAVDLKNPIELFFKKENLVPYSEEVLIKTIRKVVKKRS